MTSSSILLNFSRLAIVLVPLMGCSPASNRTKQRSVGSIRPMQPKLDPIAFHFGGVFAIDQFAAIISGQGRPRPSNVPARVVNESQSMIQLG
jgi:hypothetical protein